MKEYQGMRWFKCDLQMQTPADSRNWRGSSTLGISEKEKQSCALEYARRCYEEGLEVVAITDHNYLSKDFIPYLKSAFSALSNEYGYQIVLFPGFEIEADVGKGMHVLCIFRPDISLEQIDHILTECGVGHPRMKDGKLVKSTKRLPDIINVVQKPIFDSGKLEQKGIVVIPHVFGSSLFNNGRISEWLQQEEYLNPDLLAVEVPKPVSQMNSGFQKLFNAGEDCELAWKRERSVATIMSSDCKVLRSSEDSNNYIGCRYTWIKMSRPSIESLRQAFLDHESRIRLPENPALDENPDNTQKHARILSISVQNAGFLRDQEIVFSPHLNCVIGGRGSGKSSILEGMRLAMGKMDDPKIDNKTTEKINRIKQLYTEQHNTEVKVHWRNQDGVEDYLIFKNGECQVEGRDLQDLTTYLRGLPIQFFSQQQLNQLTDKNSNLLLSLLDDFIRDPLNDLESRERNIRSRIEQKYLKQDKLIQVGKDILALKQELEELDRQWEARSTLQEASKKNQGEKAALHYISKVQQNVSESRVQLTQIMEDLVEGHSPIGSQVERWPESEWFSQFDQQFEREKINLQKNVLEAVHRYEANNLLFLNTEKGDAILQKLKTADERFNAICREQGVTPEEISRIHEISQKREFKKRELENKEKEKISLSKQVKELSKLEEELDLVWKEGYELRLDLAKKINTSAMTNGRKVIEVEINYFSEETFFKEVWNGMYTDRRSKLGKIWEDLGDCIFSEWKELLKSEEPQTEKLNETGNSFGSVWNLLQEWLNSPETVSVEIANLVSKPDHGFRSVVDAFTGELKKQWQQAKTLRIPDKIDMILYRPEGTEAGRLNNERLSDGQRNTAALAILLAQGNFPLVLDQPEDELDSSFIYRELIPMIRKLKNERQIILATHNANIPVNGDAELIYALESQDGHGQLKAQGGLDQEKVADAVLEIMEGSEPAFKKRKEKYHF